MMKRFLSLVWLLVPFTLAPIHYAHAYLDPGAGSYAIQMAIGVIFGASYALKSFGSRFVARIRGRHTKKEGGTLGDGEE